MDRRRTRPSTDRRIHLSVLYVSPLQSRRHIRSQEHFYRLASEGHCRAFPAAYDYAITVFGFNVLILLIVYTARLELQDAVIDIMAAAVVAYLMLGPIVFMTPLLPFRDKMRTNRNELMSEIALRIRFELEEIRKKIPKDAISKEDEELVERLRKIGTVIGDLPVWPFDIGTLRRFLTAYIIPIIIPIATAGYAAWKAAEPTIDKLVHFFTQ
jgi:hypothetical protein